MGRVSKFMKAVSDKPKDAPGEQKSSADARTEAEDLNRLIACWPRMPEHFKQAILTLVEVTENTK